MDKKKKHLHAYYDLSEMQAALPSAPPSATVTGSTLTSPNGSNLPSPAQDPTYHQNMLNLDGTGVGSDAVPSLPQDREFAQNALDEDPNFRTFEHTCPPAAGIQYSVIDQGISGPKHCRLTMYNAPVSESLRRQTELPLAMIGQPFAAQLDYIVPTVEFESSDIPRCRRCRAYINPSMLFSDGGMKFHCNMCQFSNSVPDYYFQPIDATNRRIDWQTRPELSFGTYDIAAPPEYNGRKPPQPMNHIFLIDVTSDSIKKELPQLAAMAIRLALYGRTLDPEDEHLDHPGFGGRVGIVTFDRTVHFYNLHPNLEKAQMIVMSDLEDAFAPIQDGLFVDPIEGQPMIESLLGSFEALFSESKTVEPAFGAALSACRAALDEYGGGHITAILSGLPVWGPGHLVYRQPSDAKFECTSPFYDHLAKEMAMSGIGVDIILAANSYVDAANCTEITRKTGGQVFSYRNFDPRRDGKRFISDVCLSRTCLMGYDVKIRARCSTGLQVHKYMGNLFIPEDDHDDPVCGSIGEWSTFAVHFAHDGKLNTKLDCHYQIAILYTSLRGQRRIRVLNLVTGVSEQYKQVLNFVDVDACIGVFARECVEQMRSGKDTQTVKAAIDTKVTEVFASYRSLASSNLAPSVLLMPTSLRSLLVYCLCLKKSRLLTATTTSMDTRVTFGLRLSGLSSEHLSWLLYPKIHALHRMQPSDCIYDDELGVFSLPPDVPASMSAIDPGGAYLLFNGQRLILFLEKDATEGLLEDLFGVYSRHDIDPYMSELPEIDTLISEKTRELIDYYRIITSRRFLGVQIARQGLDGAELDYMEYMVEDRSADQPRYLDYVTAIHRKVKVQLEEKKSKKRVI